MYYEIHKLLCKDVSNCDCLCEKRPVAYIYTSAANTLYNYVHTQLCIRSTHAPEPLLLNLLMQHAHKRLKGTSPLDRNSLQFLTPYETNIIVLGEVNLLLYRFSGAALSVTVLVLFTFTADRHCTRANLHAERGRVSN